MKITILFGTETGNAEMLAEDIGGALEGNHDVAVRNLADFPPSEFERDQFYLFVCSTYGDGDLPASAQPFGEAMEALQPDLAGVRFSAFGLGDSAYPETFNGGSKRVQDMLTARGASLVGERVVHDASGADMADDLALPWALTVVMLATERAKEPV